MVGVDGRLYRSDFVAIEDNLLPSTWNQDVTKADCDENAC
jgi:hypothetical protein